MHSYTLKKNAENEFQLLNEDGKNISALEWLSQNGDSKILAFYGSMGAGKTTFIKWLCRGIGIEDEVNSPTFAIVNVYERKESSTKDRAYNEVYHFDCYRLKNLQEALDMGAEDYLYSGNYCFIEWPEVLETILPENSMKIRLSVDLNANRIISLM